LYQLPQARMAFALREHIGVAAEGEVASTNPIPDRRIRTERYPAYTISTGARNALPGTRPGRLRPSRGPARVRRRG
jgi:hypothetical protein